jgi:class 3 adenylate cyclase
MGCRVCGAEPREDARFCDACGSPIGDGQPAENKQVTVLFADVVHSMDIAAAVGAERLREIMTEVFNRSGAVVQRYGGTVDKFTGDGIMAVFGAPTALEDHAVRGMFGGVCGANGNTAARDEGGAPRRRGTAAAGGSELG